MPQLTVLQWIEQHDPVFERMMRDIAFTQPARDPEYKAYIRSRGCLVHPDRVADPHHVYGSLGSLKSSDRLLVPLCRECHEWIELHPAVAARLRPLALKFLFQYLREKPHDE